MHERDFLKRQVRRMAGLKFFPEVPEAVSELVNTLGAAPGKDAAESFVSQWLRTSDEAPRPADIFAAFAPSAYRQFNPPAPPTCETCSDSGFEIIERGGVDYARPCACRRREPCNEQPTKENNHESRRA